MTEDDKLEVWLKNRHKIDLYGQHDVATAQRVHDMTDAWKARASEPSAMPSGWRQVAEHLYQRLDLGALPDTPSLATTSLDAAIATIQSAVAQANIQVQSLATRDGIIQQQSNILDAFAAILKLESGKLYMDMVPMLQALVATHPPAEAAPQLVGENNTPVS